MNIYSGKFYHVVTYGCQMNVHESEKIRGLLSSLEMKETLDIEKANVVVFNTCCIREGAEDRAYNNIMALRKWKEKNKDNVIVLPKVPQYCIGDNTKRSECLGDMDYFK